VDRPDVPIGKKYVERNTVIHLKKAGMLPVSRLLEAIEKSGHPVSVSRLNIRKRSGEPDSYDVEVGVSAFDRSATAAAAEKK
jgi:general secretion pathway protein M